MARPHTIPQRLGHDTYTAADVSRQKDERPSQTILAIDEHIRQLHQRSFASESKKIPDFSAEILELKTTVYEALQSITTRGEGAWVEYYFLLNRYAFIDEFVYAPIAFSNQRHRRERRELINGAYGMNAHILQDALEYYDSPQTSTTDRDFLRGIINEQTALALLNRRQGQGQLALPATVDEDYKHKTDVVYYTMRANMPYVTNVQVKTSRPLDTTRSTPKNGILVCASDMNNARNDNFPTSRAIVDELYGVASDEQLVQLGMDHKQFMHKVESEAREVARPNARQIVQRALFKGLNICPQPAV